MTSRVAPLRDRLEASILEQIGDTRVNGDVAARLPNTTNISFKQLAVEPILLALSEQGICGSAGSACSSGSLEPSHVIRAMGTEPEWTGAIRLSLSGTRRTRKWTSACACCRASSRSSAR